MRFYGMSVEGLRQLARQFHSHIILSFFHVFFYTFVNNSETTDIYFTLAVHNRKARSPGFLTFGQSELCGLSLTLIVFFSVILRWS